eukprot:966467-Pyramimonas_sp.AAC.1
MAQEASRTAPKRPSRALPRRPQEAKIIDFLFCFLVNFGVLLFSAPDAPRRRSSGRPKPPGRLQNRPTTTRKGCQA